MMITRKLVIASATATLLLSAAGPALAQDADVGTTEAAAADDDDSFDLGWLGLLGLAGLLGLRRKNDDHVRTTTR